MSIIISGPGGGILASGATVGATAQAQVFTTGVGVGASPPAAMLGVRGADSLNTSLAANVSGATGTGFVVTNAGNVGIGTTGPEHKLSIIGTDSYPAVTVGESSIKDMRLVWDAVNDVGQLNTYANAYPIRIGSDWMYFKTDGNVGIGTTSPTAALHLPAGSTARASLCIPAGTAPTAPNAGDIWVAGTVIKFYNGTTTKELAFV